MVFQFKRMFWWSKIILTHSKNNMIYKKLHGLLNFRRPPLNGPGPLKGKFFCNLPLTHLYYSWPNLWVCMTSLEKNISFQRWRPWLKRGRNTATTSLNSRFNLWSTCQTLVHWWGLFRTMFKIQCLNKASLFFKQANFFHTSTPKHQMIQSSI